MENNNNNGLMKQISDTIGLPLELVNKAVSFMGSIISPAALEAGSILHDQVRSYRFNRQITMLNSAAEYCRKHNIKPTQVALKNIVPLLEIASLEEEESIQNMWSNLLNDTVSSEKNHELIPSFIDVLKQLSPNDAKVLKYIRSVCVPIHPYFDMSSDEFYEDLEEHTLIKKEEFHLILHNKLFRLGLVDYIMPTEGLDKIKDLISDLQNNYDSMSEDLSTFLRKNYGKVYLGTNYDWITTTYFCDAFIEACSSSD